MHQRQYGISYQNAIAVISDKLEYLGKEETEYARLKEIISGITYQNQNTRLTDGFYSLLEDLVQTDDGTLRRIVLVADGVDDKELGYTREELEHLIRKTG